MVNNRKNAKEGIIMMQIIDSFKRGRKGVLYIGIFCFAVLGGILLRSGIIKASTINQYGNEIIAYDDSIDTLTSQNQKPSDINKAIGMAIKDQGKFYLDGEAHTEAHIILDTVEKNGIVKVYTLACYGAFGFENGIFTKISGSGAIPTVMTFRKNQKSEYTLIKYQEPVDGSYYVKSIKKMFPKKLWGKVLSIKQSDYLKLTKQQEKQAKEYLKSIHRSAKVTEKYVEKKPVKIDVQASNKLFAEKTKYDAELNNFPDWIGTRELIQNGVRYIYETSQSKSKDGNDMVTFKKTDENGKIIKVFSYEIVDHEPKLISE
jgi:hypothetical protein